MKKALTIFLAAILLTGLCACATDNYDNTLSAQAASYSAQLDELNKQKSELEQDLSKISAEKGDSTAEADKLKAKIEELDGTIDSFSNQLSAAKDENNSLAQELSTAEQTISELRDKSNAQFIAAVNGGKLYKFYAHGYELRIVGDDGKYEKIYETVQTLCVSVAPDRNRILIGDFDCEGSAKLSLYDISSKKLQEIKIENLPVSHAPVFVKWYSDRSFLFVEQLDHGTVTLGGTVYCYDTETGNYRQVVATPDNLHQIMSFDSFGGETVFQIGIWEETMNEYETVYRTVSNDQIAKAIASGKAIMLK